MEEQVAEFRKIMAEQLSDVLTGMSSFAFARATVFGWWEAQPEKTDALRMVIKEETLRLRSQCEELFIEIPKLVL